MVISEIVGGLGNQMFQYAAGRALSLAHGHDLMLDLSKYNSYTLHHGFEIDNVFSATVKVASTRDIRALLDWRASSSVRKVLSYARSPLLNGKRLAIEPHFHYWDGLKKGGAPRYLSGYWQSELYFKDISDILRSDFTFKLSTNYSNTRLAETILSSPAVSLHVRRGDYLTHKQTAKVLCVCSLNYYRRAIRFISEYVNNPHFFIFSDDMNWAKLNIRLPFATTYVECNYGRDSYRDMHLMHLCKHHIIANSSFSWWGAWLNPRPSKIVVAPKTWFYDCKLDIDLIPSTWIRL